MVKIIDFRAHKRVLGNDFTLINKLDDEGKEWSIAIWRPDYEKTKIGDILILGLSYTDNRLYQIVKIKKCKNPEDMAIVQARFIPNRDIPEKTWNSIISILNEE